MHIYGYDTQNMMRALNWQNIAIEMKPLYKKDTQNQYIYGFNYISVAKK